MKNELVNINQKDLLLDLKQALESLIGNMKVAPKVYTIEETALILKCKERTIKHHLYESKDLRYCKIGREVRIREEDLEQFLINSLAPCVYDQEVLS